MNPERIQGFYVVIGAIHELGIDADFRQRAG
jgi:hypothetical protein